MHEVLGVWETTTRGSLPDDAPDGVTGRDGASGGSAGRRRGVTGRINGIPVVEDRAMADGPQFLAIAAIQPPESQVRHHLMVSDGKRWDSVAEFHDPIAAAATVATFEELAHSLMVVRIGGDDVTAHPDPDHPGIEWVAFAGAPAQPGEPTPDIAARLWILPADQRPGDDRIALALPQALPGRAVAQFYDADGANRTIARIDAMTRSRRA